MVIVAEIGGTRGKKLRENGAAVRPNAGMGEAGEAVSIFKRRS